MSDLNLLKYAQITLFISFLILPHHHHLHRRRRQLLYFIPCWKINRVNESPTNPASSAANCSYWTSQSYKMLLILTDNKSLSLLRLFYLLKLFFICSFLWKHTVCVHSHSSGREKSERERERKSLTQAHFNKGQWNFYTSCKR